ncbi:DsbA family oxidoreductase [Cellvibrio polysaccharolyticus]|uniref:DsbA family oxidoreductase n=1 Tax=Cellvibrio polysaccharolyticus TaxID=2082724 RepID=A0A928YSD9_9GAMM|nr:DsbA family oxidoreductase [Cellvibrio polysaccharolyticus]MBE8715904.1 DsbA family oxidoreductase [Cellvibrio polysaccharolyticus]
MNTVKIDIVSDIACPWCAIGFARLEKAIQQLQGEINFDVEWHPFELNPDSSSDGEPVAEMLSRKYGRTPEEIQSMQDNIQTIARDLGLNFDNLHQRDVRHTFHAHRLVKWAAEQGRATEMEKALFEAYFGHNAQIADPDVLADYAGRAGLDSAEARKVLLSDQYATDVRQDEARWQQAGIHSVPAFVINNQYLISGAQEPETLVEGLRNIANEAASAS